MIWEPVLWNLVLQTLEYINNSFNSLNIFLNILLGQMIMFIGILGIIRRVTSILLILLSLELTLLGINFSLIFVGILINQPLCLVVSLILLILSAVETAVGLALVFLYHKAFETTSLKAITKLRY
jgi:NADH-quinone oxidoreductase subunit K